MNGNPRPHYPGQRPVVIIREQAANPVVRHLSRENPLAAPAASSSDPHMLPPASRSASLVAQTREIIDFILDDPDPGLAEIRQRLRRWVDAYPGFPDRALLEHMIETCRQANAQRPVEEPVAPAAVN